MTDGRYDTPRAALEALADYPTLERVVVAVLQARGYPDLVITESTGDLGRDGFVPARFGTHDETALLVTARKDWPTKLDEDLDPHLTKERVQRPGTAIFATSRAATERGLQPRRDKAQAADVALDAWGQSRPALELEKDDLRPMAERELHVRPALPGVLRTVASFRDRLAHTTPGADAEVVGREQESEMLETLLGSATTLGRAPVVLLAGPAGVGKTRLAVDTAHESAATVVAPTSVPLRPEDLVRVAVDEPSVLIVDDAHRSPDLSGLPAMLADDRYDRAAVVLTTRPGFEQAVLGRLGLAPEHAHLRRIAPLTDRDIDEIISARGFEAVPFRNHVADAAQGIPLVAHMACDVGNEHGLYRADDTATVVERFVRRRLEFPDHPSDQARTDERRATAVAVAALAGARGSGREDLAALAPAIGSLPSEPDRLTLPLNDLLDSGLVGDPEDEGRTHVIRPDAAGPVLLANGLTNAHRVRIDPARLLHQLGCRSAHDPTAPATAALGLPRPTADALGLAADTAQLATQLGVIAQAAHVGDHVATRELLRRGVIELTDTSSTAGSSLSAGAWIDVVTLAGQAAAATPDLIGDVHQALVAQWPVNPSMTLPLVSDGPEADYAGEVRRLLGTIADQMRPLDHHLPALLVPWVLDAAWLSHPVIGAWGQEDVRRAIAALSNTRVSRGVEYNSSAVVRKAKVTTSISTWLRERSDHPPDGLVDAELSSRPPGTAALIATWALDPLLSLVTDEIARVPGEPGQLSWAQVALDSNPGVDGLRYAVEVVEDLYILLTDGVDDAAADPQVIQALQWVVTLPVQLAAESVRGYGSDNRPLSEMASTGLRAAADRLSDAIVAGWDRLPPMTRWAATDNAVRRARTHTDGEPTLTSVAAMGNPIAQRAIDDDALADILTLLPVDADLAREAADGTPATTPIEQRREDATVLGARMPLDRGVDLLNTAAPSLPPIPPDFVEPFCTALGAALPEPQPLLDQLAKRRFPADTLVVRAALVHHFAAISDWLDDNATSLRPDLVELAHSLPDLLPDDLRPRHRATDRNEP